MKIKILNWILLIDICTILLVLAVTLIPSGILRIVLGLPFVLFFPGYTLVSALFVGGKKQDGIERVALSLGSSVAIVALIGFGLNFTVWGIRLEPVLYSVATFIILTSVIAIIRRAAVPGQSALTMYFTLKLPVWEGSLFNKSLSLVLIVFVIGALTVLGYTITTPKIGEQYTEFYILGLNDTAQNYPDEFVMSGGQVTRISYSAERNPIADSTGKITLGLVNHEYQQVSYSIAITVNGEPVSMNYDGNNISRLEAISLEHKEKWEHVIGFAPLHVGENQKVEILLYKNGIVQPDNSLHLWVNARDVSTVPGS